MAALIEAVNTKRVLGSGKDGVRTLVLDGVSLTIEKGEYVAIVGPSGSGKSTLLYLLGMLDRPSEGQVLFEGRAMHQMSDEQLAGLRNQKIGFIYQFHFLLPEFTSLENVMIPMLAQGRVSKKNAAQRAGELLSMMGLADQFNKRPNQLSGGQQQRVAVARAMANNPSVILGDEPTGNLDTKNSSIVFDIFEKLNREMGQTLIIVTHDPELAKRCKRKIRVVDGKVVEDTECSIGSV